MRTLLRFPSATERDRAVDAWMRAHAGELGAVARHWFGVMRACSGDVRELLHDGHPTDAAALRTLIHTAYADIKRRQ